MTTERKRLATRFNSLTSKKRIQFIVAALFSTVSVVALPVYAWFVFQTKVETMSYVNDPPSLSLASGHNDSVECFELRNIDVERSSDGNYYQDFVFSVETEDAHQYDLQLAHTTNIPFVYEIYRVKEDVNGVIEYTIQEGNNKGDKVYYSILSGTNQTIQLVDLNDITAGSREIGNEAILKSSYDRQNYVTGDTYNQYVEPLYSVARNIITNSDSVDGSNSRDYFVLRVKWKVKNEAQGNEYWDYAFNDKETDILYITVKEGNSTS